MSGIVRLPGARILALVWAFLLLATIASTLSQPTERPTLLLENPREPDSLSFMVETTLYREEGLESGRASVSVFLVRQGESWRASYTIIFSSLDRRVVESTLRGLFNYDVVGREDRGLEGSIVYVSNGAIYKCELRDLPTFRVETNIRLGVLDITAEGKIVTAKGGEDIPLYIEVAGADPRSGYTLEAIATLSASTIPLCGDQVPRELFNLLGGVSLAVALLALLSVFWRHRIFRSLEASYYYF